jgi:hypothetical protein
MATYGRSPVHFNAGESANSSGNAFNVGTGQHAGFTLAPQEFTRGVLMIPEHVPRFFLNPFFL